MADRKISELTALTTTATGDLIPIVDVSEAAAADKNKSITVQELFQGIPGDVGIGLESPNAKLEVRGGTIRFGDNDASGDSFGLLSYGGNTGLLTLNARSTAGNTQILFNTSLSGTDSEAARIDSNGELLVGKTTADFTTVGTRIGSSSTILTASSTSTNLPTANGGSLKLVNSSATDGNFSHIGGYNSNGLVVSQIDFINTSHASRTGEIAFFTHNGSDFTERMRIDSSGNVGIGTQDPSQLLHLESAAPRIRMIDTDDSTGGQISAAGGNLNLTYDVNGVGSRALTFNDNSGEQARFDSSGRLLLGTPSAIAFNGVSPALQVQGSTNNTTRISIRRTANDDNPGVFVFAKTRSSAHAVLSNGDNIGQIEFYGADGTDTNQRAGLIACQVDGTPGSNDMPGRLVFSTTADGGTTPGERMRISSNGRYYFNTLIDTAYAQTSDSNNVGSGTQGNMCFRADTGSLIVSTKADSGFANIYLNKYDWSSGEDSRWMQFNANGSVVGNISYTGSAVAYNTTSDYRLKENIVALTNGIDRVKQLNVNRFNFINNPGQIVDGFIAHEVQTVVPEAICGEKDAVDDEGNPVYQGIDQSKLVPLLTAALQEAIAKIETLEQRLSDAGIA